jgi:hypothetical protein
MSIKCPSNDENGNFKRHIIICCTFISHVEFATKKIRIFETVQKLKNTVWKMVQTVFSERFQTIQNNGLLIRVTDGLGKTVGNSRRFEQNSGQFCPKTVQHLLLFFFFYNYNYNYFFNNNNVSWFKDRSRIKFLSFSSLAPDVFSGFT